MADSQQPGKLTDLTYLSDLSKGNNQFVMDMVGIFLEENPKELSMLEQGIVENDFRLINASAHKLRSTVPFVGIDRHIESEIEQVERLAIGMEGKNAVEAKAVMDEIEGLYARIRSVCKGACEELKDLKK